MLKRKVVEPLQPEREAQQKGTVDIEYQREREREKSSRKGFSRYRILARERERE